MLAVMLMSSRSRVWNKKAASNKSGFFCSYLAVAFFGLSWRAEITMVVVVINGVSAR
jgi:hypothetical protein